MLLDLIGEGTIITDPDQTISSVFKGFSCPSVLLPVHRLIMVWPINEHANTRSRASRIIEVGLNKDVGRRRVLGEIGQAELVLMQVVEKVSLKRGRRVGALPQPSVLLVV